MGPDRGRCWGRGITEMKGWVQFQHQTEPDTTREGWRTLQPCQEDLQSPSLLSALRETLKPENPLLVLGQREK